MRASFRLVTIASFAAALLPSTAGAQVSQGGEPPSTWIRFTEPLQVLDLPEVESPGVPDARVPGEPLRYGVVVPIGRTADDVGVWEQIPSGDLVWRVALRSQGALSLAAIFGTFEIPPGAQMYVHTRSRVLGAYTHENANADGSFAFEPLEGQEIVLEYFEPRDARFHGLLELSAAIHDYAGVFDLMSGAGGGGAAIVGSGACEVDVACEPGWANEKRAIVRLLANGALCTGAMLNNTANDGRQYLMTAYHCGNMNNAIVYFNYERPNCGSGSPATQTVSGTTLRASRKRNDFRLVEVNPAIPASFNHYCLGWNRTSTIPPSTTCIHHPSGDVKKISFDNNAPQRLSLEWRILQWDSGVTEPGSSGSPLITQGGRHFIGQLWGGASYCGYPYDDYYRRFDLAWPYVASFLDPLGTAPNSIGGFDP